MTSSGIEVHPGTEPVRQSHHRPIRTHHGNGNDADLTDERVPFVTGHVAYSEGVAASGVRPLPLDPSMILLLKRKNIFFV